MNEEKLNYKLDITFLNRNVITVQKRRMTFRRTMPDSIGVRISIGNIETPYFYLQVPVVKNIAKHLKTIIKKFSELDISQNCQ